VALVCTVLGMEERVSVLCSFIGLILGFVWVNKRSKSLNFSQWHPKLIRKQIAEQAHIPMCEID